MTADVHIAVEGPMGAGKTSLAQRLSASLGTRLLLEQPAENPFLADFYTRSPHTALATEISFLLQRHAQWRSISLHQGVVSDFYGAKGEIFAPLTLPPAELTLYRQVVQAIDSRPPTPDLLIFLHAPLDTLWARVQRRHASYEARLRYDYLRQVSAAYAQWRAQYPGLCLDFATDQVDFVADPSHYKQILTCVSDVLPTRNETPSP